MHIFIYLFWGGWGILGAFTCPTDAVSLSNDTCSTLVFNHSRSARAFRSAESIIHASPLNLFPSGIFQGSIFHSIRQIFFLILMFLRLFGFVPRFRVPQEVENR